MIRAGQPQDGILTIKVDMLTINGKRASYSARNITASDTPQKTGSLSIRKTLTIPNITQTHNKPQYTRHCGTQDTRDVTHHSKQSS